MKQLIGHGKRARPKQASPSSENVARGRAGTAGAPAPTMDQDQANRGVSFEGHSELDAEFGELVLRGKEKIEDYVQSKPHAALGIAAALGFVLGGGLTPRRLIRLGFAAGGPLLSRQLASEALRLVTDAFEESSEPKKAKRRHRRASTEAE